MPAAQPLNDLSLLRAAKVEHAHQPQQELHQAAAEAVGELRDQRELAAVEAELVCCFHFCAAHLPMKNKIP